MNIHETEDKQGWGHIIAQGQREAGTPSPKLPERDVVREFTRVPWKKTSGTQGQLDTFYESFNSTGIGTKEKLLSS